MENANRFMLLALFFVLACVTSLSAAPQPSTTALKRDRSSKPITIKSDELKADKKGKTAVFSGHVVARQDDVTIYADKLIIYYGNQEEDVDKIEAIGSVRILQTNRIGTGGHAVYENKEGKVTLTGNPKVTQDKDSVSGKTIVYYLDEERSEVTGGPAARVEAVIHPKSGTAPRKNDGNKQP